MAGHPSSDAGGTTTAFQRNEPSSSLALSACHKDEEALRRTETAVAPPPPKPKPNALPPKPAADVDPEPRPFCLVYVDDNFASASLTSSGSPTVRPRASSLKTVYVRNGVNANSVTCVNKKDHEETRRVNSMGSAGVARTLGSSSVVPATGAGIGSPIVAINSPMTGDRGRHLRRRQDRGLQNGGRGCRWGRAPAVAAESLSKTATVAAIVALPRMCDEGQGRWATWPSGQGSTVSRRGDRCAGCRRPPQSPTARAAVLGRPLQGTADSPSPVSTTQLRPAADCVSVTPRGGRSRPAGRRARTRVSRTDRSRPNGSGCTGKPEEAREPS
jgi:hypothetical protein